MTSLTSSKPFTLKPRHQQILLLLYKYRFLNRKQIQQLLGHTYFNRIIIWLNQLSEHGYIYRYYDSHKVTEPAIYSLATKARTYLLKHMAGEVEAGQLNRVWKEKNLSLQFRKHCLLLADVALALLQTTKLTQANLVFLTKVELHEREDLVTPLPDAVFSITEPSGQCRYYFLDIFDELMPRMMLRKRVNQYCSYFEEENWQDEHSEDFPAIIFICAEGRAKKYLHKQIKKKLLDFEELVFLLSTAKQIQTDGTRAETLEQVTVD